MVEKRVRCQKCGSVAKLLAVEGEIFPAKLKPPVTVEVIDCPKCGLREQPESTQSASVK